MLYTGFSILNGIVPSFSESITVNIDPEPPVAETLTIVHVCVSALCATANRSLHRGKRYVVRVGKNPLFYKNLKTFLRLAQILA